MFHGAISRDIAIGLEALRARIQAAGIPSSRLDESFNLATWNIRELGRTPRQEAAIHYLAEIIGQFDLVSVVELGEDLHDLGRILPILGPYWRAIYSDVIPDPGGDGERIAFLYDKRALTFTGFAAEANPARTKIGHEYLSAITWWRSPYIASFRAGSFDFMVITAHIRWDEESSRIGELQLLANWIEARRKSKGCEDKDILVTGDFNCARLGDDTFKALTSKGLRMPGALAGGDFPTDLRKVKHYDQILHYPVYPESFIGHGGMLDFFAGSIEPLFRSMTRDQFTYQLSDHLPLWIQVNTDVEGLRLDQIIRENR